MDDSFGYGHFADSERSTWMFRRRRTEVEGARVEALTLSRIWTGPTSTRPTRRGDWKIYSWTESMIASRYLRSDCGPAGGRAETRAAFSPPFHDVNFHRSQRVPQTLGQLCEAVEWAGLAKNGSDKPQKPGKRFAHHLRSNAFDANGSTRRAFQPKITL